jgi:hypothetical protein
MSSDCHCAEYAYSASKKKEWELATCIPFLIHFPVDVNSDAIFFMSAVFEALCRIYVIGRVHLVRLLSAVAESVKEQILLSSTHAPERRKI